MRRALNCVHVHFIWATWDRLPMIIPGVEPRLYGAIWAKYAELKCPLLALGGIENHVHLLVRLHPMVSQSQFVHDVKGSSSHLITHAMGADGFFKWQGAYASFAVEVSNLPVVGHYIANQKEHHQAGTERDEWETIFEPDDAAQ